MEIKTKYNVGDVIFRIDNCIFEKINKNPIQNKNKLIDTINLEIINSIIIQDNDIVYETYRADQNKTDCYCCFGRYHEFELFATKEEAIAIIEDAHKTALNELFEKVKNMIKENGYE